MTIDKRETEIKTAFFARFDELFSIRQFFVQHNQDVRKSGWPDTIIHGFTRATSWEFKHGTPNFSSPGIQEVTCARIAKHSYCRYVIFFETQHEQKTLIAHPYSVLGRAGKTRNIQCEVEFEGFAFDPLAAFIHAIHHPERQ